MFLAAYFAFERRTGMVRFLIDVYALFAVMVLGLILVTFLIPTGESMGRAMIFTVLRLLLFIVVLFPALWWCNRDGKVMTVIRNEFISRLKA